MHGNQPSPVLPTEPPGRHRPARGPFVGRTREMAKVAVALARAAAGEGSAIFLSGEPGIGKTRLAREILDLARGRGFQALEGRAYALEATLAYGPIVDAFGPLLRHLDRARLRPLIAGLPDLRRLFGDLPLPDPLPLGDPALEKTRLFEAFARLLARLAHERPVVLFLDDLHWADPASLELLHYAARSVAEHRVLLLATYRAREIDVGRELPALLMSLRRAGLAQELEIPRLQPDDVAELVRGILDGGASGELLGMLQARTGGVPLFVDGLLRALLDAGHISRTGEESTMGTNAAILPTELREMIFERLRQLDATEWNLVNLLAVGGAALSHATLLAVSQLDAVRLEAALGRLGLDGLVSEEVVDAQVVYRLTHPLIQEAAYGELSEISRRRAHAALARALEALRPDDLEELARHYGAAADAVDPDRALEVLLAAGERARAMHAPEQVARHFEGALRLARGRGRVDVLPLLLERLGEAWEHLGEGGAAVALWAEAIGDYERRGDTHSVARLHRLSGAIEWERGRWESCQQHLARGLNALADQPPSQELTDLLLSRATTLRRMGDVAVLPGAVADLHDVAEQLNSPRAQTEALLAEVELLDALGEDRAAWEKAQLGVAAADDVDDPLLTYRARDLLIVSALVLGNHRVARQYAESNQHLAQRLGAPTLESRACLHLSWGDLAAGSWDEALRHSGRAVTLARRVGRPRGLALALGRRAMVLAQHGDLAEAEMCVTEALAAYDERSIAEHRPASGADLAEAMLALEQGDAIRARAVADVFARAPGRGGAQSLGLALLAEAQAAVGDGTAALATVRAMTPLDRESPSFSVGLAGHAEGKAWAALGKTEAALECFGRAADTFAALEMPFEAARARLAWASLDIPGTNERRANAAQASLAEFERLGARLYADRARRLLRELGVRLPAPRRPRAAGPLSPRELDVARLVAERLSNAEIAGRLVLSPRTVTTHLERMYTRLGIGSRAELARYIAEAGLMPQTN